MFEQGGIRELTFYERKEISFTYPDISNKKRINSVSNTGQVYQLVNNQEINLDYKIVIGPNFVQNFNYTLTFKLFNFSKENQTFLKNLRISIYGWAVLIDFYNNDQLFLNVPFKFQNAPLDNNSSNHYLVTMTNVIPSRETFLIFGEEIIEPSFLLINDSGDKVIINAGGDNVLIS